MDRWLGGLMAWWLGGLAVGWIEPLCMQLILTLFRNWARSSGGKPAPIGRSNGSIIFLGGFLRFVIISSKYFC